MKKEKELIGLIRQAAFCPQLQCCYSFHTTVTHRSRSCRIETNNPAIEVLTFGGEPPSHDCFAQKYREKAKLCRHSENSEPGISYANAVPPRTGKDEFVLNTQTTS